MLSCDRNAIVVCARCVVQCFASLNFLLEGIAFCFEKMPSLWKEYVQVGAYVSEAGGGGVQPKAASAVAGKSLLRHAD